MNLRQKRRAIRLLLDQKKPADAMAAYYAYYHEDDRTELIITPPEAGPGQATGYVAASRTGIDLFRPLLTMRLPIEDLEGSAALLRRVLPAGAEAFIACPPEYDPLVRALCHVRSEEELAVYVLDHKRFERQVNVLVTREDKHGLPRFVVKQQKDGRRQAVSAAGVNWQSPHFAEIAVRTWSDYRRKGLGKAVVSQLVGHLLDRQRQPLYSVGVRNQASIQLARRVGFVDSGAREMMLEVQMRPS